ncbi:MAG: hypothetical protein ACOCWG_02795 [bacterium]
MYAKAYQDTIQLTKKHLSPNQIVFDYAYRTSIKTIELVNCVQRMVAIDISDKMIEIAGNKAVNEKIKNI